MQAGQLNILVLAYLGDSVLEVLVRDHLVLNRNIQKVNDLQKNAVAYVGAKGQATFMKKCKEENWLTEEEMAIYRRGRNAKGRKVVKNMDVATHNESTGFEAVIGWLHLCDQHERIKEIFEVYHQFIEEMEK